MLYRRTVAMGLNTAPTKDRAIVEPNKLPYVKSAKWFFIPAEHMGKKSLATPAPIPVSVDRAVSERVVRHIIRKQQNVSTLKGYEILCEVNGQLYTNIRQCYDITARIVR